MRAKEIGETEKSVSKIVYVVLGLFSFPLIFYASQFYGGLSNEQAVWGEFGDFLGGVMNPIISMAILFIVAMAYLAQKEELAKTVKALSSSAEEQAKQNKIALLLGQINVNSALLASYIEQLQLVATDLTRVNDDAVQRTVNYRGHILSTPQDQLKYIGRATNEVEHWEGEILAEETALVALRDKLERIDFN